jgi:hypothetical protein
MEGPAASARAGSVAGADQRFLESGAVELPPSLGKFGPLLDSDPSVLDGTWVQTTEANFFLPLVQSTRPSVGVISSADDKASASCPDPEAPLPPPFPLLQRLASQELVASDLASQLPTTRVTRL